MTIKKSLNCSDKTKHFYQTFLSNWDSDIYCLNCFGNLQNKESIKKHKRFCENSDNNDRGLPRKFKPVSNKSTGDKIQVPANILKHLFRFKSLYQYVKVFYDFEIMLAKLNDAELKLEELRKKNQSYTVKTHKHVPTNFALCVHYSKELEKENEYFVYRKNISWMYLLKR